MSIDLDPRTVAHRPGESAAPPPVAESKTPTPPRMPGRRNPKWMALGIVALCLGGLLSYAIYARVATEASVVAVKETVYRGEVIHEDDLTTAVIQGDSFPHAFPASRLADLVGQRAAFDLPAGSLVADTSVTDVTVPPPGSSVVGLKLSTGQAPATLLLPSAPVRLIALPSAGTDTAGTDQLTGKTYLGHVLDQAPDVDGTSVVVNVEVEAAQAPTVALLAAQNRLAVVRDSGR
jgi:hypothetical protein